MVDKQDSGVDLKEARARLERMRLAHLGRIDDDALAERDTPEATEGPRDLYDSGDMSTYEAADSARLQDAERATVQMRQIEDALGRIDDGSYGICVDCSEPVGAERLRAVPTAERCINCQEIYDRDHASGAHHATL